MVGRLGTCVTMCVHVHDNITYTSCGAYGSRPDLKMCSVEFLNEFGRFPFEKPTFQLYDHVLMLTTGDGVF